MTPCKAFDTKWDEVLPFMTEIPDEEQEPAPFSEELKTKTLSALGHGNVLSRVPSENKTTTKYHGSSKG